MSIKTPSTLTTGTYHVSNAPDVRHPGRASYLGNTLSYFYAGSDKSLILAGCNISTLIGTDMNLNGLTKKSNWFYDKMSDVINDNNHANFKTDYAPASVVMDQDLSTRAYYFWVDTHENQVYASYNDNGAWSQCAYKVQENSGGNLKYSSYLDAYTYGGKIILVLFYYDKSDSQANLDFRVLDVNDIDNINKRWESIGGERVHINNLDESYYKISVDWVSQGDNGDYAVASLYSSDDNKFGTLISTLNSYGFPKSATMSREYVKATRGATVRRTLAGNLEVIYCDQNHTLGTRQMNTYEALTSNTVWENPQRLNGIEKTSDEAPAFIYIQANSYEDRQTFAGTSNNQPTSKPLDTINSPVYRVAFYASGDSDNNGSDLKIQGSYEGSTQFVQGYSVNEPEDREQWVPTMIMDAFPVPNENITTASNGQNLVEVYYGTSSESSLKTKVEWQMLFGIKSDISTTKGIGPAIDTQFKAGPNGSLAGTTTTKTKDAESVITSATTSRDGNLVVSSGGVVHGNTLPTLSETATFFSALSGLIPNSLTAPIYSALSPVSGTADSLARDYEIYSAVPGDIGSYTKDRINDKMRGLYNDLHSSDRQKLSSAYARNYVEDVIEANAQYFGNTPYLEFTIATNGHGAPEFAEVDNIETTFGFTFDASVYVGAFVGEGVSAFGFGEEAGAKVQAGFDFNLNTVAGLSDTKEWGISSKFNLPSGISGAYDYTVRMYVCKPNVLWANELALFGNMNSADKMSSRSALPGKIFFVVPENTINSTN